MAADSLRRAYQEGSVPWRRQRRLCVARCVHIGSITVSAPVVIPGVTSMGAILEGCLSAHVGAQTEVHQPAVCEVCPDV